MAYWIYKCNAKKHPYQVASGDWDEVFASVEPSSWGSTEWTDELRKARAGDVILAYQTDRNELVGLARVVRFESRKGYRDIILRPLEELRVKVRPLKKASRDIGRIDALQPGPIHTLYSISATDADKLLKAAKAEYRVDIASATEASEKAMSGGGFGSPEENRRVERAAVTFVRRYFKRYGWGVRDVSATRCHYDLECRRGRSTLHVEVKGTRGTDQQFILTHAEAETWKADPRFRLALVTSALAKPRLFQFRGPQALKGFHMKPIAFVCVSRAFA